MDPQPVTPELDPFCLISRVQSSVAQLDQQREQLQFPMDDTCVEVAPTEPVTQPP